MLDGLIENAGPRFQRCFADEPLLERLRVCATDSLSDAEVKKKCQILFRQWAITYQSTPGMERIVALQKQLPKRKKPVTQAQSRVLQETERQANEDPFSGEDDDTPAQNSLRESLSSPTRSTFSPSSAPSMTVTSKQSKKSKSDKEHRNRAFNLEKEKPQILEAIASSSVASTNLMNALKLLNRENIQVSDHAETVNRFETCKGLRRRILRYIHQVESEQWLGSLINANDQLVEALMAFEILDKSIDDDSDSDRNEWSDREASPPPKPTRPAANKQKDTEKAFAGLSLGKAPAVPSAKPHPTLELAGQSAVRHESDEDGGNEDDDDPFADSNAVHTPKAERPGMTW